MLSRSLGRRREVPEKHMGNWGGEHSRQMAVGSVGTVLSPSIFSGIPVILMKDPMSHGLALWSQASFLILSI